VTAAHATRRAGVTEGRRTRRAGSKAATATGARGRTADRELQSEQLLEIQCSRLIAGAVHAIDELGYAQATVGQITRRASVSRRTFYELFADREACLVAVLESVVGAIAAELAAAGLEDVTWRERVRRGLATILACFDREPALARVCVVQALRGGPDVLRRREEVLARVAAVIDEGRAAGPREAECSRLTAEGLVGAAFGIVYARLLREEREPLTGLLGELMGMVVLPYLGPAAARREQARPATARAPMAAAGGGVVGGTMLGSPLRGVPVRLTYRTARVLESVAELQARENGASNRLVAERAGVNDQGQISKHLRRLERAGLLANTGSGHARGEPNAWTLTARGEQVARSIRAHTTHQRWAA
jgi:AcrR family transcriptional regulator